MTLGEKGLLTFCPKKRPSMLLNTRRNAQVMRADESDPPMPGAPSKTATRSAWPPPSPIPTETHLKLDNPSPPSAISGDIVTPPSRLLSSSPVKPYKPEYAETMLAYFESKEKTRTVEEEMVWKNGEVTHKQKEVPEAPPMFSEFARTLGVSHATLKVWAKNVPEFREAYIACQEIFKEFLIANGLLGHYSSQMTIFTAKNETDMKDKSTVDHRQWDMKDILDRLERGEDTNRLESPPSSYDNDE